MTWWFLVDPLIDLFSRLANLEDELRNLRLISHKRDEAIKDHEDSIVAMQDRFGNALNHLLPRTDRLEERVLGQSFTQEAEAENTEQDNLISINARQRSNMGQ